jgi:hypothetical protein
MLGLGQAEATSKCADHKKQMPLSMFDRNPKTGLPYSKCRSCKAKADVADAKYYGTERYKEKDKKRKKNATGKATAKRYKDGEAGQEAIQRGFEARKQRRRDDPAVAMMHAVHAAAKDLVSGRHQSSPTFVARTSFTSEASFLAHLEGILDAKGWTWEDHGTVWHIEHKIPQQAFDFSDPEDIKRCWSHANVHAMTKEENDEKHFKIIDSFCTEAGSDRFPKSWNGAIPTEEQKQAFYARVQAGQAQNTGAGSSNEAFTSEEEGSAEADSAAGSAEEDSAEED